HVSSEQRWRKLKPDEEASRWACPLYPRRHVARQRREHEVATRSVDGAQAQDVRLPVPTPAVRCDDVSRERARPTAHLGRPAGNAVPDYLPRSYEPTQAKSWRERL